MSLPSNPVTKLLTYPRRQGGFTLVELMVVIAVMGILVAFALPQYSRFQAGARDATRQADLESYYVALQRYYNLKSYFPVAGDGITTLEDDSVAPSGIFTTESPLISEKLIPGPIHDPLNNSATGYFYRYTSNSSGTEYFLYAKLETGAATWWVKESSGLAQLTDFEPAAP